MRKLIKLLTELYKMLFCVQDSDQDDIVKKPEENLTKEETHEPDEVQEQEEQKEEVKPIDAFVNTKDKYVTMQDINTGIKYSTATDIVLNKKVSKYFTLKEALRYNDATQIAPLVILRDNPEILLNIKKQAKNLDAVREFYGKPVIPTSWYRTNYWNKKVGGATNSQHKLGLATDFVVVDVDPRKVQADFESTWKGGMGRYKKFTHLDSRDYKTRWDG